MQPSLGKQRRLQQAAGPNGTFAILAIDHRGPLHRRLAREPGVTDVRSALLTLKQDIVRELAPEATAVLLDPEAGLEACVRGGALPGNRGLLVALDTGSTGDPAVLETGLVEDWSVERIARVGGAGVKLLVYYHPEAPGAAQVEARVREVGAACASAEIPFFLEPLSFCVQNPAGRLSSHERRSVVIESARRLGSLGADILKAEFPVDPVETPGEADWRDACAELTEASPVPWVLLSAGVSDEVFVRQARAACEAGASGVMAGRAVWNEAVSSDRVARQAFLREQARPRLARLRALCEAAARPVCF